MYSYLSPSPRFCELSSDLRWLGSRFAIVLALVGCLATSFNATSFNAAALRGVDVPQGDIVLNDPAPGITDADAVSGADEECSLRAATKLMGTDGISCPVVHIERTQSDRCIWVDTDLPQRVRFGIWSRDTRSITTDIGEHDLTTLLRMHVRLQV